MKFYELKPGTLIFRKWGHLNLFLLILSVEPMNRQEKSLFWISAINENAHRIDWAWDNDTEALLSWEKVEY